MVFKFTFMHLKEAKKPKSETFETEKCTFLSTQGFGPTVSVSEKQRKKVLFHTSSV